MVDLPKPTVLVTEKLSQVKGHIPSEKFVVGVANYFKKLHLCKQDPNCKVVQ